MTMFSTQYSIHSKCALAEETAAYIESTFFSTQSALTFYSATLFAINCDVSLKWFMI